MLAEIAEWATIIGVPLMFAGVAVPFAVAVGGRQRDLRQRLRQTAYPLFQACDLYLKGDRYAITEGHARDAADKLRIISKRDGLKAPNQVMIGQLIDILLDIAARFGLNQSLPGFGLHHELRAEFLQNNARWLEAEILTAAAQAATLIRSANAIDNGNYWVYLKCKRFGMQRWKYIRLPRLGRRRKE
ncbi:hypothetical protein [Mycobacterium shigaense]|uniref:Uncharacterized protein n=1 Tax=Mycobacterium shigaense TaxID=722731 RepID=A0A1Z4EGF5_9MYCO|nr:hypothetical protein [Mycobacterium shigaense]PRI16735.1 hypothetical protein B2J96_03530 [Mycobacterium shigaense]BAX92043.1 hypothetical protein MSG_01890 [Mycobacterium shigaense]